MENQIYIDNTAYLELFDGSGFYKVSAYTGQPELLDPLAESIQGILQDKADITTSDALYQQMKAPLTQITRVVSLMRLLTFFAGTVIVSLLLCMWMRSRQKTVAVFCGNRRFSAGFLTIYRYRIAIGDWQRSGCNCCIAVFAASNPCKSERYSVTNGGIIR